ncbi:unnamed protein product, partial [Ectocarpus sp. 12 AP-2014]
MGDSTHQCPANSSGASALRTHEHCDEGQVPTPILGETQQQQPQVKQRSCDDQVQRDEAGLAGRERGPAQTCAGGDEKGDGDKHDGRPTMQSHKRQRTDDVSTESDGEQSSSDKIEDPQGAAGKAKLSFAQPKIQVAEGQRQNSAARIEGTERDQSAAKENVVHKQKQNEE